MIRWLDSLLDWTIYFSFDKSGFKRHQKVFLEEDYSSHQGKRALITGGTSGIGFATACALAEAGVNLVLIGSTRQKGEEARNALSGLFPTVEVEIIPLDLSNLTSVYQQSLPPIDIHVNNAGAMPHERTITPEGYEMIFASQVLGHFILTKRLLEQDRLFRVVFVSSGGMYTQKLMLDDLNWENKSYNYYKAYANAKRAQIVLTEIFAQKYPHVTFSSMHPGWVDTAAVKKYMPGFYRFTRKRLRKPDEGADTIVWLALTKENYPSGKFWFDRKLVSPHMLWGTREDEADRVRLWSYCKAAMEKASDG